MQNWKTVWGGRVPGKARSQLQTLIELDGFDSGAGRIGESAWRDYVTDISRRLGMMPGQSVCEIGCGSGAFLYPLREAGMRVAGLDYSSVLIAAARRAIPEGDFRVAEAADFTAAARYYDFVVANSVFHYFPDDAYAKRVLAQMLAAADKAVAVLEVPDQTRCGEAEAARRALLSVREYETKYAGLAHRYYSRETFLAEAQRNGFEAEILDQEITGYAQNAFRFNCLMRRNGAR